jgi:hypothetical protein
MLAPLWKKKKKRKEKKGSEGGKRKGFEGGVGRGRNFCCQKSGGGFISCEAAPLDYHKTSSFLSFFLLFFFFFFLSRLKKKKSLDQKGGEEKDVGREEVNLQPHAVPFSCEATVGFSSSAWEEKGVRPGKGCLPCGFLSCVAAVGFSPDFPLFFFFVLFSRGKAPGWRKGKKKKKTQKRVEGEGWLVGREGGMTAMNGFQFLECRCRILLSLSFFFFFFFSFSFLFSGGKRTWAGILSLC